MIAENISTNGWDGDAELVDDYSKTMELIQELLADDCVFHPTVQNYLMIAAFSVIFCLSVIGNSVVVIVILQVERIAFPFSYIEMTLNNLLLFKRSYFEFPFEFSSIKTRFVKKYFNCCFRILTVQNFFIVLVVQQRSMRSVTNIYLLNLALSDLLLSVVCMPPTLVSSLVYCWVFGDLLCKLLAYLQRKCPANNWIYLDKYSTQNEKSKQ